MLAYVFQEPTPSASAPQKKGKRPVDLRQPGMTPFNCNKRKRESVEGNKNIKGLDYTVLTLESVRHPEDIYGSSLPNLPPLLSRLHLHLLSILRL